MAWGPSEMKNRPGGNDTGKPSTRSIGAMASRSKSCDEDGYVPVARRGEVQLGTSRLSPTDPVITVRVRWRSDQPSTLLSRFRYQSLVRIRVRNEFDGTPLSFVPDQPRPQPYPAGG